jgi:hypothetical protein
MLEAQQNSPKENIDINQIAQVRNIVSMNLKFINLLEIMAVGIIGL